MRERRAALQRGEVSQHRVRGLISIRRIFLKRPIDQGVELRRQLSIHGGRRRRLLVQDRMQY